jgi:hypothetical protein
MTPPKAKFIEELYDENQLHQMVFEFQEKGYTILPNVFERESVKEFKAQLEEIMYFNGNAYTIPDNLPHYMHSILAPRCRQILPFALSHSVTKAIPALHTSIFVIETDEMRGQYAPDWHKDREPDGMPGKEYHYPKDVFIGFYFEDIDEDQGPTQIIPGSHRDNSLLPNIDAPVESIHLRMEDALLLDQRAWHRGVARKAPGTRFVFVYGMYAMPHHYGTTFQMPRIQMKHWMHAKSLKDRVFFGGPFAPPTQETINAFQEEYDQSERLQQLTFPKMM